MPRHRRIKIERCFELVHRFISYCKELCDFFFDGMSNINTATGSKNTRRVAMATVNKVPVRRRLAFAIAVAASVFGAKAAAFVTVPRSATALSTTSSTSRPSPRSYHSITIDTTALWVEPFNRPESVSNNSRIKKRRPPNVRMKTFAFLNLPKVEVVAALAVLLSSFLVAVDTLDTLPSIWPGEMDAHVVIGNVLTILNVVFAIDFFVRWYAAGNFKGMYLKKPLVILDIFCILVPLVVATLMPTLEYAFGNDTVAAAKGSLLQFDSTGLQNLLLLRILRLRRVLTDSNTFGRFQAALGVRRTIRPYQLQLARVLLSIFTLLSVASGLIYTCEKDVNPNIQDYFSALYFGLTTLTTVGFGDISPVTAEGRLVVCLSILAGVAVIPAQTANLVDAILQFNEERKRGGPRVTITPPSQLPIVVSSKTLRASANGGNVEGKVSQSNALPRSTETATKDTHGIDRVCAECNATDHRQDASFCWSCGTKLN